MLVSDAVGFAYDDECFTYTMTFSETRDRITQEATQNIGFNISFRTLGDFGTNSSCLLDPVERPSRSHRFAV